MTRSCFGSIRHLVWGGLALLCSVPPLVTAAPRAVSPPATSHSDQPSDIQMRIQEEQEIRAIERADFLLYFAEAYREYPQIPRGTLEAMAFVGSRWIHLGPAAPYAGHHNMPQAYGAMGLYHGQSGFGDVVRDAADARGVSEAAVLSDAPTNILATAALLNQKIAALGLNNPTVEQLRPVLEHLSGLPGVGRVAHFARTSYVYDVLLVLDRGHDDWGIRIPDQDIQWEKAFSPSELIQLRAPLVRIGIDQDMVEIPGVRIDPTSETAISSTGTIPSAVNTTDYAPALWVTSPNYSSRSSSITHVAIHTVQGSYSGCISWFQNPDSDVSAHYVMRSSDGQVTQMVREYNKAWHIGSENGYTLGTEHEGYVETSQYYTDAMYNSSSALTKDMCTSNAIDCSTTYGGASSSTVDVLSQSYHVKGHQHYPNQTHTDPGQYWDWARYKSLITGSSGGGGGSTTVSVLDSFESSEGHFATSPTYSGSTVGISTSSTAERSTASPKNGAFSEQIKLLDNSSSSSNWEVRFLSGVGDPAQNVKLKKSGGKVGFWVYSGGSGISVAIGLDDSDGTERSTTKAISATTWTYVEWKLDDASHWNAWYNGNGTVDSSTPTIDAIWLFRDQTSYTVYVYVDDVSGTKN